MLVKTFRKGRNIKSTLNARVIADGKWVGKGIPAMYQHPLGRGGGGGIGLIYSVLVSYHDKHQADWPRGLNADCHPQSWTLM